MAGINPMRNKGKGRRKIEIREIENKATSQVMFSKRRSSLFDSASELSILTGAEVAIIASSQKGKILASGHPSVDSVINHYLTGDSPLAPEKTSPENQIMQEHKEGYIQTMKELEVEKRQRMEEKSKTLSGSKDDLFWWDKDVESMGLEELEDFIKSLEELRNNVRTKAEEKAKEREMAKNFGAA